MPKKKDEVSFNFFFYVQPYVVGFCVLDMFFCYV